MATLRSLLPYLWPQGDRGARTRVVVAMGLLLAAKVATVYVPVLYGRIVDALAPQDNSAALAIPIGLVVGYGLLRVASAAFGELRIYQQLSPGVEHAKTLKFQRLPGDGSSPFWHYTG